ncbi:MAG: formamidopyrimidine DNA glycosylase [bacterium]|nr:formamidopyrimidine DNA glycosylase [bacterium]
MPEGDTIHKLAAAIAPRLAGQELVRGTLRDAPGFDLAGRRVARVFAHGKHLFVETADGLVVRSHLGMHGSWHRYAPGERWRKPAWRAGVVLSTARDVIVCFDPKEVECVEVGGGRDRAARRRVGPDVTVAAPGGAIIAERAARYLDPAAPVVDLLLDQRVASGIGNVYKSEVLFLGRVPPWTLAGELGLDRVEGLYRTAHELLSKNLGGGDRVTRFEPGGDLWVYGRAGRSCYRCAAAIDNARMGRDRRSTFWCTACQGAG